MPRCKTKFVTVEDGILKDLTVRELNELMDDSFDEGVQEGLAAAVRKSEREKENNTKRLVGCNSWWATKEFVFDKEVDILTMVTIYVCPHCGKTVEFIQRVGTPNHQYCPNCGKGIIWGINNEDEVKRSYDYYKQTVEDYREGKDNDDE